jgi:hypothetical protein
MTDQPVQTTGRRPLGVLIVAALQFARAALLMTQVLRVDLFPNVNWLQAATQIPEPTQGTVAFAITRALGLGLVVASILAGAGLLAGRRWGWIGSIVLAGLSMAFAIAAWWDDHPVYLSMALNVIAVFYLNQRELRAIYEDPTAADDEVRP